MREACRTWCLEVRNAKLFNFFEQEYRPVSRDIEQQLNRWKSAVSRGLKRHNGIFKVVGTIRGRRSEKVIICRSTFKQSLSAVSRRCEHKSAAVPRVQTPPSLQKNIKRKLRNNRRGYRAIMWSIWPAYWERIITWSAMVHIYSIIKFQNQTLT